MIENFIFSSFFARDSELFAVDSSIRRRFFALANLERKDLSSSAVLFLFFCFLSRSS